MTMHDSTSNINVEYCSQYSHPQTNAVTYMYQVKSPQYKHTDIYLGLSQDGTHVMSSETFRELDMEMQEECIFHAQCALLNSNVSATFVGKYYAPYSEETLYGFQVEDTCSTAKYSLWLHKDGCLAIYGETFASLPNGLKHICQHLALRMLDKVVEDVVED